MGCSKEWRFHVWAAAVQPGVAKAGASGGGGGSGVKDAGRGLWSSADVFGRKCGTTDVWWKGGDGMDGAVIQAVVMLLTLWQHLGGDKMTTHDLMLVQWSQ